jgi:hypothetical protein
MPVKVRIPTPLRVVTNGDLLAKIEAFAAVIGGHKEKTESREPVEV